MAKVSTLLPMLHSSSTVRQNLSGLNLSGVNLSQSLGRLRQNSSSSDSSTASSRSSQQNPLHQPPHSTPQNVQLLTDPLKSIPVHKWDLKFNGEATSCIVMSFLDRVDELKVARHISDAELFTSAIDLFEGKALLWFRSVQGRCRNWTELSALPLSHY